MARSKYQRDHSYKLLVVGDEGVGKTAFSSANSILHSTESTFNFFFSYNVRKKEINLNGKRIKLKIYDGSSATGRHRIIVSFDKVVHGIFIIYDATNREYGIQSNVSIFEVSAQNFTNVELAFQRMVLKIQSYLTSTINCQLGQYRERIGLEFVRYTPDVDSNVPEQNASVQGLHDNRENENVQLSTESDENADVTHPQGVDEDEMGRAQIPSPENQTIEEKAKQPNVISFSKTLKRIFFM
ncbi:unnamed protein product [Adineta steineri]|uniref:Uncharacterized protein n=1 Tax=Adineta steineri TaxID=433720 RepID=A0A819I5B2_9BILA|nr:unnamed protein product [Adineta steineri]CAF3908220.1 unnamed protein product [Adineta steineri]